MPGARVIRQLSEAAVIAHWMDLYASGKHKGKATPNPEQYLGRDDTWVEVEVPHDLYDADWNNVDTTLSDAQMARADRYAAQGGALPPGMATFKGRRTKLYVSDGNHRAYAAYLRGAPTARFYVPLKDWQKFAAANSLEA